MSASRSGLIVHNVYFTLADRSEAARSALIASCQALLAPHPGVVFFACGPLCSELTREVNDLDWDVGLHLVFASKAAHDSYQESADHLRFIAESKPNWTRVRVFDTVGTSSAPTA